MRRLAPLLSVTGCWLVLGLGVSAVASAAAGDPDPSFGTGGFTILDDPVDTGESLYDVVVLPDGRILAGGERGSGEGFLLARFNANGSPDTGFGDGGISALPYSGLDGQTRGIFHLDVMPDGRVVGAGLGLADATDAFAIARYTADGSALDPAFNSGDPVVFRVGNQSSFANDVAVAPGVKVVAVGRSNQPGGDQIAVARRTATGAPDMGFNVTGERLIAVPGSTAATGYSVDVLPNGSMVVAGEATQGLVLVKLTENGTPDPDFGTAGFATHDVGTGVDPSGTPYDTQVLADGRILATGYSAGPGMNAFQFFIARFTEQGELDPSFGAGGVLLRDFPADDETGYALEVLPDGRILVAGSRGPDTAGLDTWLQRFTADGALDPTFGSGGEVTLPASTDLDEAFGLTLDPLGRAVVAGPAREGANKLFVARFLGDPEPPPPPPPPPAQPVLDPDLRELELTGRRLTPFGVTCEEACAAQIELRSRGRVRLPHASTHRRGIVTIARATLAGGVSGRRAVRLTASRRARAILKRRRISARLSIAIQGGETVTRNVVVRAAQRKLNVNRRGRGSVRVTFQAEADRGRRATLTLRLGGRVAARKRVTPTPGRSRKVSIRLKQTALARLAPGGRRAMRLTLRYRSDTGENVSQSRRLRVARKR